MVTAPSEHDVNNYIIKDMEGDQRQDWSSPSPRFLCHPTTFCLTCWSRGRQSALHKENSGFPAATQHDFALDPMISSFHFHFGIYKCDLAILTEWWQQHIAWWELLNAMCQIICIYYVNNIQITWKTIYLSVFCRTNSSIYSSNQSRRK